MSGDADWLVPGWDLPGVGAVMTTRAGGASAGPFASMNLGGAVGDAQADVQANRAAFARYCGAVPVYLRQVHGAGVAEIGRVDAGSSAEGDASVTTEPGVACTVLVADCLPVLFAAPSARAVGAAHAGWRGLAAGVVEATLAAVARAGACAAGEVEVWLGACIGARAFEVGADVLAAFGADPAQADHAFFRAGRPGRWLADLPALATERLRAAGARKISGGSWCTLAEPSRFFSFRRDRVTGRMAAAVWIRTAASA